MDLETFRGRLDRWLDEHAAELAPDHSAGDSLDADMAQLSKVKRLAYDAGWMRWGWPERIGGLGGSPLLRGYLGEALTARDLVEAGIYSMTEVLAPTMIDFARPELAAAMVPRLLRGDETWCQGFSEPGTGSNLAALTCRATRVDDDDGDGWRVTGQKVWTSLAQYAQRCVLLTRTGTVESAHRGITALFVDMDTPGITVRPIETMHGREEFCEVFFDDVAVPVERTLGDEGQGWSVAMDLLPYERSTALWHRGALLHRRLEQFLEAVAAPADGAPADGAPADGAPADGAPADGAPADGAPADGAPADGAPSVSAAEIGEVFQQVHAIRARSLATQRRLAAGERLGPETSIDKILLATAEQALFDLVADGLTDEVVLGDDARSARWRSEYLYSRAATIYGGSAEIQRNIVARRLLDLGSDR
jgi:alkylation response protein AidB-like acyl-CoA dehydrogenase